VVIYPIVELGFLRIGSNARAPINVSMADARKALEKFLTETNATRIPDDLPALESNADKSERVTDSYSAELAEEHGLKFATLDTGIKHRTVKLIPWRE